MSETQAYPLGAPPYRALGGSLASNVRQPYLGSPPQVVSVTGLGAGSGAFVMNQGSDADQSQGLVVCQVGLNPAASGVVTLFFPIAPTAGQYVATAEWSAALVPVVSVNNLSFAWAANRVLATGERLLIAYRWAVST